MPSKRKKRKNKPSTQLVGYRDTEAESKKLIGNGSGHSDRSIRYEESLVGIGSIQQLSSSDFRTNRYYVSAGIRVSASLSAL
jgi:hypothetical protein